MVQLPFNGGGDLRCGVFECKFLQDHSRGTFQHNENKTLFLV